MICHPDFYRRLNLEQSLPHVRGFNLLMRPSAEASPVVVTPREPLHIEEHRLLQHEHAREDGHTEHLCQNEEEAGEDPHIVGQEPEDQDLQWH